MNKKLTAVFMILTTILFSTISCKNATNNEDEASTLSRQIIIYNNRIYYFDGFTIYYKRLNDLSIEPTPLCSDSLCSHDTSACPLFLGMQTYTMAIDENESTANNNYPIVYISSNWAEYKQELGRWDEDGYRIIRYDSAKNTYTTIVSKIPNGVGNFCLYKDYIFYTVNDGDAGNNIYAVTKDGKYKYLLDNPQCNSYTIIAVENDTLYYTDFFGNIYKSDLKLKTSTFILQTKSAFGSAYIYNGYLYYAENCDVAAVMGTTEVENCTLYRIPINETDNVSAETVIENIYYAGMPYFFKANNKLYYCCPDPEYIGLGFYYDVNKEKQNCDVFYNGTGTIYSYNMDTSEICTEIENEKLNFFIFYGGAGNYIIYKMQKVLTDLTQPYSNYETILLAYNIITKEQVEIKDIE